MAKLPRPFFFAHRSPILFLKETVVSNKKRKRKTKLPFLLLIFSLFLLVFSEFQLLKSSSLACFGCGPGSQDFWIPG